MSVKISIIGAGSAVFSVNLIKDICLTKSLKNSTVSLMDIDRKRLEAVYYLCKKYSEEIGLKLNIEKTTDRKKSIDGADFVINTALAESNERLREGWKIAKKYGYKFGGSLHIMHDEAFWVNFYQLKLMESILIDVLEENPSAWYLLVANPVMAGVTYLKRKYPESKVVGMCHGSAGVYRIAEILGLEKESISFEVSGVNHFIFLTKFLYKGKDAYHLFNQWLKNDSKKYFKRCSYSNELGPKVCDLYKKLGLLPIGDTASPAGGTWPWWYHSDDKTEYYWKESPEGWWSGYFNWTGANLKKIQEILHNKYARITDFYPPKYSGEPMIRFIQSIVSGVKNEIVLNIINDGEYIKNIPKNFEVEIPVIVDSKGLHPKNPEDLPEKIISYILRDRVAPVNMEIEAYRTGSFELLKCLVMMDPWTKSEKQAYNFIKEIISLPYHSQMERYYR